jgi:hypothetical protein
MWTIIILIIAVVIIWAIVSNNNDNEKIREYNLYSGGLKTKFPNFAYLLTNEYNFNLKFDDGRNMCFSKKTMNSIAALGELNIGLKLDVANQPIIYSSFKYDFNEQTAKGTNVSGFFDNNMASLIKCVDKSIEGLGVELNFDL